MIAFTLPACDDTSEDLIYLRPGIPRSTVIERLGNGIPPSELPLGMADHEPPCLDVRYYKTEYRSKVARRLLGEPGSQGYWRVCFDQGRVTAVASLGIVTR
jgi:hypothetical protein